MPTYAVLYFKNFSYSWEKSFYAFECVNRIPKVFDTITVPTRDGTFEGVVVDITTEAKYPVGVYKI